jgi:hypothetical protein
MKQHRARMIVLGIVVGMGACERPAPARSNDTVALPPPLPSLPDSLPIVPSPWDSVAAGPALLVVAATPSQGFLVVPTVDSNASLDTMKLSATAFRGIRFDLLTNGRILGQAGVGADVATDLPEDCTSWPMVQLTGLSDSTARGWVVGFGTGHAAPIPFDSITGLSPADSMRLAIDVARLASAAPNDTVAQLRGLPFQVRRAYRFPIGQGVEGLIAEVLRTLNQEASPRQEHLVLIAERDSATPGKYETVYVERTSGGEESLEATELLVTARLGVSREPVALLARYVGDGAIFALIERQGPRRWRLRWTSPYTGC